VALDVLSETPQFQGVRERYAEYIPVWVSFPLWARIASERSTPPPIEEVVAELFRAQSRPELAREMQKALRSARVLLLVDGLDEALDVAAAQTAATLLSAFVEAHACPTLLTSRPHGLRSASGFGGTWTRVELAPLSELIFAAAGRWAASAAKGSRTMDQRRRYASGPLNISSRPDASI
jgi:hypothetical protein